MDTDDYKPDDELKDASSDYDYGPGDDPLDPLRGTVHTPAAGDPAAPLRPGDTLLGRFRLLREFRGGMSRVWAAWDVEFERFVVLKFVGRLLDEARRAVNVPGDVIRVFEHNADIDGHPFLVLEYARGGPLDRYTRAWAADPPAFVRRFVPAVRTLGQGHGRGIVHRDLKPGNLLLWGVLPAAPTGGAVPDLPPPPTADELAAMEVRVADWGLATSEGESESGYGGTSGFAAPEQWREAATPLSDVFGLAATLYFLLANPDYDPDAAARGGWRYAADPSGAARAAGRATTFRPPPLHDLNRHVDPRLSRIVMRSLAVEPGERHASADALANDLQRWLDDQPIDGDDRRTRARLWVRRNRRWAAPTALAALAALALAVWAVVSTVGASQARADAAERDRDAKDAQARAARVEADNERVKATAALQLSEARNADQLNQLTAAARAAAHRGDWKGALPQYERLIAGADPATARELRVERLFGFFAVNDEVTLTAELKALTAEPALSPGAAARLLLVRGGHAMCDAGRAEQGRRLVRQALDARAALPPEGRAAVFSAADMLYAEALLEARPRPVLDKLRAAVRADALHYPAHSSLVLALVGSGDPAAAVAQAELLESIFPDSPVPPFARALNAIVVGDRAAMLTNVKVFGARAGEDIRLLEEYCATLADILDLMEKHTDTVAGLSPIQLFVLAGKVAKMHAISSLSFKPLAFPVPTAAMIPMWFLDIFGAYVQAGQARLQFNPKVLPKLDADGDRLAEMAADYPEAMAQSLLAVNRFIGASVCIATDQPAEVPRRLTQAADAAYRAAEQPTLAARATTRYYARFTGVMADVATLRLVPGAPPLHLQRVHDNIPKLIAEARPKWGEHLDQGVDLAIALVTVPMNPNLKAEWKTNTPAGAAAYRERNRQVYRVARSLLDTWADEPTAPGKEKQRARKAAELRVQLERWAADEELAPPVAPPPRPRGQAAQAPNALTPTPK